MLFLVILPWWGACSCGAGSSLMPVMELPIRQGGEKREIVRILPMIPKYSSDFVNQILEPFIHEK